MKNPGLRIAARLSLSAGARADAPPLYQDQAKQIVVEQ